MQEGAGAGGTTPLPTPDATGSTAMSATSGKVALVTTTVALTCGTACHAAAGVYDFIGYGTANDFEGAAAAPGLSNTTADLRAADGTDTDNNATDLSTGVPNPRNTGDAPPPPPPPSHAIHEIQGATHRSPLVGTKLTTTGVVTAVRSNGFWIQDPAPDADPATSEGLFVFTSGAPTVHSGDAVSVVGTVSEFRPGGANSTNLSTTELTGPTTTVTGSGVPLPAAVKVGPGGLVAPVAPRTDAPGNIEASSTFDPTVNALDFYETLEGMLVEVDDAVAVGPTNRFNELPVIPGGTQTQRTSRGGVLYSYDNPNTARLILASALAPVPTANVGDALPGPVTGVIDYNFGNYQLQVLAAPTLVVAGGDPGQQRGGRRRYRGCEPHPGQAGRRGHRRWWPGIPVPADRPAQRHHRRPAGRQHPGGVPLPD